MQSAAYIHNYAVIQRIKLGLSALPLSIGFCLDFWLHCESALVKLPLTNLLNWNHVASCYPSACMAAMSIRISRNLIALLDSWKWKLRDYSVTALLDSWNWKLSGLKCDCTSRFVELETKEL